LNQIPFASLLSDSIETNFNSNAIKFDDLNYLVNKFFISYAYSAKLLFNLNKDDYTKALHNYAAFLVEDSTIVNKYCDRSIFNIITKFEGDIYNKHHCNIDTFKSKSNKYKIINLVTYGSRELGSLAFNDGDLFESDIYNLDLSNNELTVLTSCETALGYIQKGEGVMSLSRAFTYAGSRSLVSTLWSVHPESTCIITEFFLREIKAGKAIDEALWKAQKDYINNYANDPDRIDANISTHPYYWSGIIPIGNMSPIELQ